MKNIFTTKRLCRAGAIAALYVVLTYVFAPLAFGPVQVRPAEALCLLPLLFPEAIPALFVGCLVSNLISQYSVYDVVFGSLATLLAAFGTFGVGKLCKAAFLKILLGGLFPVLVNAFIIPVIIVFIFHDTGSYTSAAIAYFVNVGLIALTQTIWVYALGTPLYCALMPLQKKLSFLS